LIKMNLKKSKSPIKDLFFASIYIFNLIP